MCSRKFKGGDFSHVNNTASPLMCPRVMFTLVIRKVFLKEYTFCASFSHVQKYRIFIAHNLWRLTVLFAMPTAVGLSQCAGIFGCLCPRSSRVSLKIIHSWQFRNSAPSSALAADGTTNCGIEHNVWNTLFSLMGFPSIGNKPMK